MFTYSCKSDRMSPWLTRSVQFLLSGGSSIEGATATPSRPAHSPLTGAHVYIMKGRSNCIHDLYLQSCAHILLLPKWGFIIDIKHFLIPTLNNHKWTIAMRPMLTPETHLILPSHCARWGCLTHTHTFFFSHPNEQKLQITPDTPKIWGSLIYQPDQLETYPIRGLSVNVCRYVLEDERMTADVSLY